MSTDPERTYSQGEVAAALLIAHEEIYGRGSTAAAYVTAQTVIALERGPREEADQAAVDPSTPFAERMDSVRTPNELAGLIGEAYRRLRPAYLAGLKPNDHAQESDVIKTRVVDDHQAVIGEFRLFYGTDWGNPIAVIALEGDPESPFDPERPVGDDSHFYYEVYVFSKLLRSTVMDAEIDVRYLQAIRSLMNPSGTSSVPLEDTGAIYEFEPGGASGGIARNIFGQLDRVVAYYVNECVILGESITYSVARDLGYANPQTGMLVRGWQARIRSEHPDLFAAA